MPGRFPKRRSRYGLLQRSREVQLHFKANPPPERTAWVIEEWMRVPGWEAEKDTNPEHYNWQLVERYTTHGRNYGVTLRTAMRLGAFLVRVNVRKIRLRNVATEQIVMP